MFVHTRDTRLPFDMELYVELAFRGVDLEFVFRFVLGGAELRHSTRSDGAKILEILDYASERMWRHIYIPRRSHPDSGGPADAW